MSLPTLAEPPSVVVAGSINMDLVVRCPRLPGPGETVLGGSYRTFPGGKGANQAVAAARMGARVSFIGRVGDDLHAARLRETLAEDNIDISRLNTSPGASGLGMITVADGGENTIVVASGANGLVTREDIEAAAHAIIASDVVLLQLEIPLAAISAAATLAKADPTRPRSVILNTAPARTLPRDLLALVDVLILNRVEASTLLGVDLALDPSRMALRLPDLGVQMAILTLGSLGSIMVYRGRIRRIPTPQVDAVDAVGAGDAFVGALAAHWPIVAAAERAKTPDIFKLAEGVVLRASAAGALATTRAGAIPSMPRRDEVEALAASLRVGS